MAETQTPAAPPEAPPGDGQDQATPWGRILDVAGLVAAGVLVVILVDIITDGRFLSARLRRRGPGPDGQESPPDDTPAG
jgi:hypothetical protein